MKQISLLLGLLILTFSAHAVNIAVGSTVTQNFTIGVSATANLPTDWKIDKQATVKTVGTYAAALTKTALAAGENMSATAQNGIYNFGVGASSSATDRSIGFLSGSSGTKSGNIYLKLTNSGTTNINKFIISYDLFQFRNGKNATGFCFELYTSTNGTDWESAGWNFSSGFWPNDDNNGYTTVPGDSNIVSNSVIELPAALAPTGTLYLAWNYSVQNGTTTSDAQALGLDNVKIIAVGGPVSGNFTVGTGKDYATISDAVIYLSAAEINNPVKLLLTDANYQLGDYEVVNLASISSTKANKTITIKPATGVNTVINGNSYAALLFIDNTKHIIIDGSNIDGGSTKNLTVSNINNSGNGIGISFDSDSCVVKNCIITGAPSTGIDIFNNHDCKIIGNKIFLQGTYVNGYQPITGISYAKMFGTGDILISNNMITINPTTTSEVSEGQIIGTSYSGNAECSLNLFNNSIYIGGLQNYTGNSYAFLKKSTAKQFNVKNNLLYNVRANSVINQNSKHFAVGFEEIETEQLSQTNNLLYVTPDATPASTTLAIYGMDPNAVVKADLSAWQQTVVGLDANSKSCLITFEPALADGDLKFKREAANAAVFNTGFALPTIVDNDFYGTGRQQYGLTDIGAYELVQSSNFSPSQLPIVTTLFQNYPNPFNPETVVSFALASGGKISLSVYNAKGEFIRQLLDCEKSAGVHNVKFNASSLNSGIYFYKLTTSDRVIIQKMVLTK